MPVLELPGLLPGSGSSSSRRESRRNARVRRREDARMAALDATTASTTSSNSRVDKFLLGLLPPWQQTLLHPPNQSATKAAVPLNDSDDGRSDEQEDDVGVLEEDDDSLEGENHGEEEDDVGVESHADPELDEADERHGELENIVVVDSTNRIASPVSAENDNENESNRDAMDEPPEQNEHAEERNRSKDEIDIPVVMAKGDADEKETTGSIAIVTNNSPTFAEDGNEVIGNEDYNDEGTLAAEDDDENGEKETANDDTLLTASSSPLTETDVVTTTDSALSEAEMDDNNDECSAADAVDTCEKNDSRAPDEKEEEDNTLASSSSSSSKDEINEASTTLSVEEETPEEIAASAQEVGNDSRATVENNDKMSSSAIPPVESREAIPSFSEDMAPNNEQIVDNSNESATDTKKNASSQEMGNRGAQENVKENDNDASSFAPLPKSDDDDEESGNDNNVPLSSSRQLPEDGELLVTAPSEDVAREAQEEQIDDDDQARGESTTAAVDDLEAYEPTLVISPLPADGAAALIEGGEELSKGSDDAPFNDVTLTEKTIQRLPIDKVQDMATITTLLAIILFVTYSLAVHFFLSFFHERSFCNARHWHPIAVRILVACVVWGMHWLSLKCIASNGWNDDSSTLSLFATEVIFAISSIIISIKLILQTRRNEVNGPSPPPASLEGKVVFITGANAGIGLETARELYRRDATVLLGCRSKSRALAAMKDIDPFYEPSHHHDEKVDDEKLPPPPTRLQFIQLDLTSQQSIHEASKTFYDMKLPLHVLINNAGVMRKDREHTVDGLEMTMAANHLGHFLLTNLLLPKLRQTALQTGYSSRVITVSSSLYRNARRQYQIGSENVGGNDATGKFESGIDLNDLQCRHKKYALFEQYAQSKLANIMFSLELGRREKNREPLVQNDYSVTPPPEVPSPSTEHNDDKTKKIKLRPKLTPASFNEDYEVEEKKEEDGLGFDDIVVPSSTSIPISKKSRPKLTPTPSMVGTVDVSGGLKKKKARRRLTPISPLEVTYEEEEDGMGLGFNDIAPTSENSNGTKKKARRKRLTPTIISPLEDVEEEEDEMGLGFNDIVSISPLEVADEEEYDSGLGFGEIVVPLPTISKSKKLRPKLTPSTNDGNDSKKKKKARRKRLTPISPLTVADEEEDETGLGFNDIVSISPLEVADEEEYDSGLGFGEIVVPLPTISKSKKLRPKLTPSTNDGNDSKKKKKARRRRLTPISPLKVADEENDETGLGFNDIVSISPLEVADEEEEDSLSFDDIVLPLPTMSKSKKLRPKLTPNTEDGDDSKKKIKARRRRLTPVSALKVADEEEDETGLGFDDIVSISPLEVADDIVPLPTISKSKIPVGTENSNGLKKKKTRRRLTPISPLEVAHEEEGDEVGLGFNDIVSTPVHPLINSVSSKVVEEDEHDEDQMMQRELLIKNGETEMCNGTTAKSKDNTECKSLFCPVLSYCLHPGLVRTNVVRDMPWYLHYPNRIFSIFLAILQKSPQAGASCSVYCAVMDKDGKTKMDSNNEGCCYFVNSELQPLEKLATNDDDAKQLWELSSKLVGLNTIEK